MLTARNPHVLPDRMPVFPLSGLVVLPFGHVPLNIFEPRYLNMVNDVLGGPRIIAMVQPRNTFPDDLVPDDAALFDVGTAARIISFHDTGDGRYHLTLEGVSRFRVSAIHAIDATRGYREVSADYTDYPDDQLPSEETEGPGRERLLELLREFFTAKDIPADWSSVDESPYEALVSSLTMSCPFEPGEKQALLECESHAARAQMLISLFEMSLSSGYSPGGLTH